MSVPPEDGMMLARGLVGPSPEYAALQALVFALPIIGVIVSSGLAIYARRQKRPRLTKNATLALFVCLLIVMGLALLPPN
jgi:ABC-type amino acid transport system permease subunit